MGAIDEVAKEQAAAATGRPANVIVVDETTQKELREVAKRWTEGLEQGEKLVDGLTELLVAREFEARKVQHALDSRVVFGMGDQLKNTRELLRETRTQLEATQAEANALRARVPPPPPPEHPFERDGFVFERVTSRDGKRSIRLSIDCDDQEHVTHLDAGDAFEIATLMGRAFDDLESLAPEPTARKCSVCGGTGHNARTCGKDRNPQSRLPIMRSHLAVASGPRLEELAARVGLARDTRAGLEVDVELRERVRERAIALGCYAEDDMQTISAIVRTLSEMVRRGAAACSPYEIERLVMLIDDRYLTRAR